MRRSRRRIAADRPSHGHARRPDLPRRHDPSGYAELDVRCAGKAVCLPPNPALLLSLGPRLATPRQIPVAAPDHVAFHGSATLPQRPGQPDRTCRANHIWSVARRHVLPILLGCLEYPGRGQTASASLWHLGGEADVDRRTTTPAAAHRLHPLAARHLRFTRPDGLSANRRFVRSLWRLRQPPGENSRAHEE